MTEYKVLYHNRDGVRRTMIEDDENPGQLKVFTEVQMDGVLASIKEAREYDDQLRKPLNRHLARVPMTVYEQSILERWDDNKWRQWLNDPDNSAFRVHGGRV